jgi:hypothetical protein
VLVSSAGLQSDRLAMMTGARGRLRIIPFRWVGPNAVLALGREAYARYQFNLRDLSDAFLYAGFYRLVGRHIRVLLKR